MIKFHNGLLFDFGCASGALAFDGAGWWYDKPCLWSGYLRPEEFTVITKTLTYEPIVGNYRWYCPWRCVRPIENGMVNAVALTNPSCKVWLQNDWPKILRNQYRVMVSIMPFSLHEAVAMAVDLEGLAISGLQVNASCPNVSRDHSVEHICHIVQAVVRHTKHPVTVKLSWQDDYLAICKELDGQVAAFELINTVPWNVLYPNNPSPLASYGLVGGVSGPAIKAYAREALDKVKKAGIKTPIISGGGIDSLAEVLTREAMGAQGFVFGTLFYRPWAPNRIIDSYRKMKGS